MRRLLLASTSVLFALACSGSDDPPDTGPDAGLLQPPSISSLTPTRGRTSGGTRVTVNGTNFEDGLRVFFGSNEGTSVTVVNKTRATALTPASSEAGLVDVRVQNRDGQSATLPQAFSYDDTTPAIAEAVLRNPATQELASAANPVTHTVAADVEVPGITVGFNQGAGVKAQVGWAPAATGGLLVEDYTWSEAAYLEDADGANPGDRLRDRYSGTVALPAATGASAQSYLLAARFSTDDGATWTVADRDGAKNGVSTAELAQVSVTRPQVEWCKLGGPVIEAAPQSELRIGQPGINVLVQVYHPDITNHAGAGAGLTAQLGFGPAGTDPTQVEWTWRDATFKSDQGNGANDEFTALLPTPPLGTYSYAYRVSLAGGAPRYCDANGTAEGGFTLDQMGTLTVKPVGIDRCRLQFPTSLSGVAGGSATAYGWVWAKTVTDQSGAGSGLTGAVGVGPAGTTPTSGGWSWTSATFNEDKDGNAADEFEATFPLPTVGSYHYAFRFQYNGGAPVYCDLDGSENGYQLAQAGQLTTQNLDCNLQPLGFGDTPSGTQRTVTGRVNIPGVTNAAGKASGLRAQFGLGAGGTDASMSSLWGWKEAVYAGEASGSDVFSADFHPAYGGARAVAMRITRDNGTSWTYCDLNGAAQGGFEPGQQGTFNVTSHADVDYCVTWFPSATTQGATDTLTAYGRAYDGSLGAKAGSNFTAELGHGPKTEDPGAADTWTWTAASFNAAAATSDHEYQATVGPLPAGTRHFAFRFRLTGTQTWCYGDLNGNGANGASQAWGGFSGEDGATDNLGRVTVTP